MRIVADTNTVVSGLLWPGKPRLLLDAARAGACQLITAPALLQELGEVLGRSKFSGRIERSGQSVNTLLNAYRDLAETVIAAQISPTVIADPDDDAVLAAALGGRADLIVSGDVHLLNLRRFHGIHIITADSALAVIAKMSG